LPDLISLEVKMPGTPIFTSDDEIMAIGRALRDRTLPKSAWTHAAHFAAAFSMLVHNAESDVVRIMPDNIRAYNVATGVANTDHSGYHETITVASIRAAASVLQNNTSRPLFEVTNTLLASPFGKSDWLLTYWTRARLLSVEARRTWCDPDTKQLPF
jgi:hypothetical protein